jgi:signal transduction histidine kinase/CHASE3 domain sensor protein
MRSAVVLAAIPPYATSNPNALPSILMRSRWAEILTGAALFAALVIVCLNAWLAVRSVRILEESQNWVAHTWQVINATERIMGSMKDAETGNRGYLLTGDPVYLAPYTQATHDLPEEFNQITALTKDNPRQLARISQMQSLVNQRLHLLETGIDQRRAGNVNKAQLLVQTGTGESEMSRLRSMANSMQDEERHLLAQRVSRSDTARAHSQWTIVIVSIIDVLLITLIFWLMKRERSLSQKAHATANRLQKLQSISDVGLTQLTPSELIGALLARLLEVIRADKVVFCNWRDGEIEVVAASEVTAHPGLRTRLDATNPLYSAATDMQIITLEGTSAQSIEIAGMGGEMHAILILPVIVSGKVAALLVAGRRRQDAFQDQDESLLSVVSDRIGIALDRANAYDAERQARQQAEKSAAEVRALNAELEERVRLRTIELEETNRELEAFSYSVSHDLRAPLRSVDGFSLALEEDFEQAMNAEGRDFIRRIRAGVQKMGQLIDSLLQLSRITRADLSREQVNISELAGDIARDLRVEHPDRNLTFLIQPGLVANADPKLLRVALENLLANAVKFTAKQPQAVVEFGHSLETREFFVRDNGAGFDMQYADKLFHAFQRLHGDKDFKGSGIGLATVSRVIRRHVGTIRTESAVDRGATFWFTLG